MHFLAIIEWSLSNLVPRVFSLPYWKARRPWGRVWVAKHVNKTMASKSLAPRRVTPHLSCKREQIKMSDYMDRQVTSPTWGPPPPCKKGKRMWSRVSKQIDLLIDWLTDHSGRKVSEVWLWKRGKLKALSSGMFTHCWIFFYLLDCGLMKI